MIKKPKGTKDISIDSQYKWDELSLILKTIAERYNFKKITTPIFESKELFVQGVGEGTDVVSKELYEFLDKGKRELALRPEGTAGVVRSYIEDKLYVDNPICKLFYQGPMFRYERPQSGRQREFWQFGTEVFCGKNPLIDFEVIAMANDIIHSLGLNKVKLHINTIGDMETRDKYCKIITKYFTENKDQLCEICNDRIKLNPMRILDCKLCTKNDVVTNAPKVIESMNKESLSFYDAVKNLLSFAKIDFIEDQTLVRGLGYYSDIVFEFVNYDSAQGAKSTIIAGGRYDGLVKKFGGPAISGVGFGAGLERLLIAMEASNYKFIKKELDIFIVNIADNPSMSLEIMRLFRASNKNTDYHFGKPTLKHGFKAAEKLNVKDIIIIGNDEIKTQTMIIKNQKTQKQEKIKIEEYFSNILGGNN